MLTLTPKKPTKVNSPSVTLPPEGYPVDEFKGFAGKNESCIKVQPEMIDGKEKRDQQYQGNCDTIGHGAGRIGPKGSLLQKPPHHAGHVGHPAGETPFIIIPGQHPNGTAADNLSLIWCKNG